MCLGDTEAGAEFEVIQVIVGQIVGLDAIFDHLGHACECHPAFEILAPAEPSPCLVVVLLKAVGTLVVVQTEVIGGIAQTQLEGGFKVFFDFWDPAGFSFRFLFLVVMISVLQGSRQETVRVLVVTSEVKENREGLSVEVLVGSFNLVQESAGTRLEITMVFGFLVTLVGLVFVADLAIGIAQKVVHIGVSYGVVLVLRQESFNRLNGGLGVGFLAMFAMDVVMKPLP